METDWVTKEASEFCSSVRDGTHDSPKEVFEGGKNLVTSRHIKGGILDFTNSYKISTQDFNEINLRSKVNQWDVLFSMIGTIGEVLLVKDKEPDYAIKNVGLFKCKSELDGKWLYYYLNSPSVKREILSLSRGTTQQYIPLGSLRKLSIRCPKSDLEKDKIIRFLSNIDEKIEINKKSNETLEAIAKALFKSWFIDFDPVRAKVEGRSTGLPDEISNLFPDSFEESELGKIPYGWKVMSLGEMLDTISETYPLLTKEEVVFLNTGDIESGNFLNTRYAAIKGLPGQAKKSIKKGDILFSEIRPRNNRHAYVYFDARDYVVSTKLMVLRSKDRENSLFEYFLITQKSSINYLQLLAESRSGTFPQITFSELKEIKFSLPNSLQLINFFTDNYLEISFTKIQHTNKQNKYLEEMRNTLLPKLISGELRIPDAEKIIEKVVI